MSEKKYHLWSVNVENGMRDRMTETATSYAKCETMASKNTAYDWRRFEILEDDKAGKSTHSPAPWHIGGNPNHGRIVYGADGYVIANCSGVVARSCDEESANARLIVAAPDLLEVLKSIENDDGRIPETIWEMRNAAIAKAEGVPNG